MFQEGKIQLIRYEIAEPNPKPVKSHIKTDFFSFFTVIQRSLLGIKELRRGT